MRKGVWVSSPDRACSKEKDDQNGIGIRKHLLSKHENFFLVVSGHYSGTGFERIKKPKDRYGNEEGFGIKFDQQSYGPEDGWVRLIEFLPKTNDIYVKDYHPTLDKGSKFSPLWRSSTEKRRKSYPNVKPRDYIHHFRYNLRYNFLM